MIHSVCRNAGTPWRPRLISPTLKPSSRLASFIASLALVASAGVPAAAGAPAAPMAFPGAQGFGATTLGGRGGRVIEVTNLNDTGSGSFRAAVTASGPRIVVFRTGGTIVLQSELAITNPYITIAGQSAPGGGVTIKASPFYKQDDLRVSTHDVVIRYLRFRPAATAAITQSRAALNIGRDSSNVVVDHVSTSWGLDNVMEIIDGAHDITVSWSIISEGLSHSTHLDGEHSRGLNISSKTYNCTCQDRNISIHNDLLAFNNKRNPNADAYGVVDFVNNVIYDYGDSVSRFGDLNGTNTPVNVAGDFYKPGLDSTSAYEVRAGSRSTSTSPSIFVNGNIGPHRPLDGLPQYLVVKPEDRQYVQATGFSAPAVTTTSADQAYTNVLADAGDRLPMLDAVDTRVLSDVQNGTGHIIDDPSQVGGWPALEAGTPLPDSDHDGMPDTWETSKGLNPLVDDSAGDYNGDGYTNVEEYLNGLVG